MLDHRAVPRCPAGATSPVGKSENPGGVWYWTENGTRIFVGVDWADSKPADAVPVRINPGLYGTLKDRVRTIYAPVAPGTNDVHPNGG